MSAGIVVKVVHTTCPGQCNGEVTFTTDLTNCHAETEIDYQSPGSWMPRDPDGYEVDAKGFSYSCLSMNTADEVCDGVVEVSRAEVDAVSWEAAPRLWEMFSVRAEAH